MIIYLCFVFITALKPLHFIHQGPKIATGVPTKKSNSTVVSKTANGVTKANTQAKSTLSTSRKADEKDKLKTSSTSQLRRPEPTATLRAKTQNTGSKPQTTAANAKAAHLTRTSSITTNATAAKKRTATQNAAPPKAQPMRAKHNAAIVEAVKKNANAAQKKTTPSKPNAVLDTYHNVTVASPPPRRRSSIPENDEQAKPDPVTPQQEQMPRVRTRTLEEEDVVVLRTDSAKKRIEQLILADEVSAPQTPVKEPVAFEINFEERAESLTKSREPSRTRHKADSRASTVLADDEQANYSDDFESYESDFETGSSSHNGSPTETEDSNVDSEAASVQLSEREESEESSSADDDAKEIESDKEEEDEEEESELTQYPVTVIKREKERERKLDSGNYEMNSRRQAKLSELSTQSSQQQFDSLDTSYSAATSEQLDSGISSYGNGTQAQLSKFNDVVTAYGGYAHFNTRPALNKRGQELMTKIQFDTLTFTLFELKPISYEIYMRTYGKLNAAQAATQTNENRMSSDCQTDDYDVRTMWTQHPPQYDLQTVQKLTGSVSGTAAVQNCCGESTPDEFTTSAPPADEYDASLQHLAHFRHMNNSRTLNLQLKRLQKPVDFERLNSFLLTASMLMSKVLNSTKPNSPSERQSELQNSDSLQSISEGHFPLNTRFLNALRVVRIYANPRHNLVVTVHESLADADVYRSDFSNLLMVWSTSERSKPIRLLSTWSEVCRTEICNDCADIVVCGLRDGSIAMWDLRETYSFCSKLDGYLTHFAATQSIVPTWSVHGEQQQGNRLLDLGATLDVKSFRAPPKALGFAGTLSNYKSIQFTSLNDTGILTVWTLVETTTKHHELSTPSSTQQQHRTRNSPANHNSRFEYSSPWARVKLIQSAICDLREYMDRGLLKAPTQFDKTKSLFQKNIYSDEALRELSSPPSELRQDQGLQGLRFNSIDTGCERIYVCTNRNFILACSKSLKTERFRKIALNNSRFLFPTALRVLTNEDFLAVGLSNGSVMIVNCTQHKTLQRIQSSKPPATARNEGGSNQVSNTPDYDPDTGKSCAIQNIILNERRTHDSDNAYEQSEHDLRPNTAACIAMIGSQQRPFELRVYDQQLLLSGSALRKHLVQSLELSSDGWRLFALANGEVRTYDFYLDKELAGEARADHRRRIIDIAVARTAQHEQHLLVLNADNDVEVHLLKQ